MLRWLLLLILLLLTGCAATPAKIDPEKIEVDMTNSLNRLSYAAGYQMGDRFQNQKLSLSPEAVLKGLYEARRNIKPPLTKAEMKFILMDPKAYLIRFSDEMAADIIKDAQTYLEKNAAREGVVVLESGLQYRILREGQGRSPQLTDRVRLNYTGRGIDGKVFANTVDGQPKELPLQTLIPGMVEGVQQMKEGAKWELTIPSKLAYADHGPLANQTLIFEVELVEVLATP